MVVGMAEAGQSCDEPLHGEEEGIVVSIPACHAGDPGSIPGNGAKMLSLSL
jgi:hypothetical protein